MTTTITTTDQILRDNVTRHLAWEPDFDASMIGVSTQDGVVTLSGYVETYAAKLAAERAARKLYESRPSPTSSTFGWRTTASIPTSPGMPSRR